MRHRRLHAGVLAAALIAALLPAFPAGADGHVSVVLTGLANPRGVHADGPTVYIAEAGVGGDDQDRCYAPDPENDPDFEVCIGETGRITSFDAVTQTETTVTVGLPSIDHTADPTNPENGFFATGPHDVWAHDGSAYYVMGLGGPPAARDALADRDAAFADFAKLWRASLADGSLEEEADLAAYEAAQNPDEGEPDTNPYSLAVEGDTSVVVADAGGNDVLRVDTTDGSIETVAVLPPVLSPIPAFFGEFGVFPSQAVPTSLYPLAGRDSYAVGQLTGFPFPVGGANVWEVDGTLAPLVEGFTNIIDVTQGPDGDLYVLQITEGSLLDAFAGDVPDFTGALYRVDLDDGSRELILTDPLFAPGGMAFVGNDLYITNCSVCPDQDDPEAPGRQDGHLLELTNAPGVAPIITIVNDSARTGEDEPVEVDVLANDTGTGLEVAQVFGENGAVWEGSVVYQPKAHFSGVDTIRYQVCDDDGDCATGVVKVTVDATATDRLNGVDRIATAAEVSRAVFPYGAGTVVIARADLYPDALAGSVLAATHGAPVLLTRSHELDPVTEAEINRLGATGAILLGGEVALSSDVADALVDRTSVADVQRVAGADRFATAAEIKDAVETQTGETAASVFVAEGFDPDPRRGFPDVLSVSALAAHTVRPILLVTTEALPGATEAALGDVTDATIVGGEVAVSSAVADAIGSEIGSEPARVFGADRYGTSHAIVQIAVDGGLNPKLLFLATGENWPDALVAGSAVALDGGVLMLVHPSDLDGSPQVRTFLTDNEPFTDVDLLGGTAAISQAVEDAIADELSD